MQLNGHLVGSYDLAWNSWCLEDASTLMMRAMTGMDCTHTHTHKQPEGLTCTHTHTQTHTHTHGTEHTRIIGHDRDRMLINWFFMVIIVLAKRTLTGNVMPLV